MSAAGWVQGALWLSVVVLLARPCGRYMARVFSGQPTRLDRCCRPIERVIYRWCGIEEHADMSGGEYARAFVAFGVVGTVALYAVLRLQSFLPGYDAASLITPLTPDLAANTAISFVTTTTWQAYGGETTMTWLSQVFGLAGQNFLAGASGLAVGIAFIRGFARERHGTIGNFWVDVVRAMLWVLLPVALVGGLLLVWQGVPMNLLSNTVVHTLEGTTQTIAGGPVAALEFIKQLGTNGGGYFNVNGAHPFENPTPLANLIELLAIAVLPASLTVTFGELTGRRRDGWVLLGCMVALVVAGLALINVAESAANPALSAVVHAPSANMEGKEVRFGVGGSALAAIATSNGATGSYNAMHDSFSALGGAVPMVNMLLGEIAFGGLGTGIVSMLMVALLSAFIAGLLVGRSPSYLGKTLGPTEMQLIVLYAIVAPLGVLVPAAIAATTAPGLAGLTTNSGAHGLSEIVYAFASAFGNNGQTFAGLSANSPFYNVATSVAMMLGRFGLIITALAVAGRMAKTEPRVGAELGAVPTSSSLFGVLMLGTALVVGGLSYLPVVALGPLAEHFMAVSRLR